MEKKDQSSGKKCPVVRLDFSGIYDTQTFYQDLSEDCFYRADLRDLPGTNCYCDEEAQRQLTERIRKFPLAGIHFLDSGNYHYMTRIWLTLVDQPFRLLVFDNHTDLQPPAFGGLLSCGGWIDSALRELPCLSEVILVGPDEAAYGQVDGERKADIRFLSREQIAGETEAQWLDFFKTLPMDLPWYLSVDKDILCPEDARTTWSQGDLRLSMLLEGLRVFRNTLTGNGGTVLGIDVCGECDPDRPEGTQINDRTNQRLMEVLSTFYV